MIKMRITLGQKLTEEERRIVQVSTQRQFVVIMGRTYGVNKVERSDEGYDIDLVSMGGISLSNVLEECVEKAGEDLEDQLLKEIEESISLIENRYSGSQKTLSYVLLGFLLVSVGIAGAVILLAPSL